MTMITAIVQILLAKPMSEDEAARAFEAAAPRFQNVPGLVRKYFLRSADGTRAGGVYLWETRAAADALYGAEWKARIENTYGAKPEIQWFDTPVVVDNSAGKATRAA
jgi:heme-degrading monooxygenase HmoA